VSDLVRIEHKLDEIASRLSKVEGRFHSTEKHLDNFYVRNFAPLIEAVTENQKSIARIEVDLAKLKTKIAIWGTTGVILVSALVSLLLKGLE